MMTLIAVLIAGASLSGCSTLCGGFQPISPDPADKLTRGTKEQIVAHNEHGEKQQCDGFVAGGPTRGLFDLFKRN